MKKLNIGDYIQITNKVRLYIDNVDIEIENGDVTVFFLCSQIHEDGVGSDARPYSQCELEKLIKDA